MTANRFMTTLVSLALIVALGVGGFFWLTHKSAPAAMTLPPTQVTVAQPVQRSITEYDEFTGNTEAMQSVEIRARVEGTLTAIHFTDGQDVKAGDLLFEIEPELYQARRDQAAATLSSAQAELERAQSDLKRNKFAIQTNAVSLQDLATSEADVQKAEAAMLSAKAALAEAELNLSYTRIVAPMDGRISRRLVDQGNLVGAGEQTLLARLVQLSPLYVTFYASEQVYLQDLQSAEGSMAVALSHESGYPHAGQLNYLDNRIDTGTGTLLVRGELPNEDRSLLPGMFVRIQVPLGQRPETLLVEDAALSTDIGGKYLLLVNEQNLVERCPVTLGRLDGDLRVILSGLEPGARYIVKGLQSAYPGSQVVAQMRDSQ